MFRHDSTSITNWQTGVEVERNNQVLSRKELTSQACEIKDEVVIACNGLGLKNILWGGQQWLEAHVEIVNNLNVFPVPDGDTGTNMWLTMRAALERVKEAPDHQVGTIAAAAAKGALMGARGNSGVILSQFLQGLAMGLEGLVTFTAEDFARAAQLGTEQAYQSVMDPVEGTILTVARAISDAAQQRAKTNGDLLALLIHVLEAAKIAQARTPSLLPVLREAGVTDSGGQGLVYILEGGLRFLNHELVDVDPTGEEVSVLPSRLDVEATYGYDVQFLIQGERLNVAEIRDYIDSIGWSTVVVGDERLVKVHVHTENPDVPLNYATRQGVISDVVVENMDEQAQAFAHGVQAQALAQGVEAQHEAIATVVVVPGPGLARIFQSLGVSQIVLGGQTKNPSVQELLATIEQVHANQVLILPNNGNVILAAQQAQTLSDKKVAVVPTKTVAQGIAALLSFNYQADLDANIQRMVDAAQQVQTIEITQVVRDSNFNGFEMKSGDVIGLLDNELVSVGQDYERVSLDALSQTQTEAYEIITIYFGQDSSPQQAEALAGQIVECYPDLEVEVYEGGQPHYQYIISLE
jgi:DAK2 domain fusion protein YloV